MNIGRYAKENGLAYNSNSFNELLADLGAKAAALIERIPNAGSGMYYDPEEIGMKNVPEVEKPIINALARELGADINSYGIRI
jgi:hypothetical protein